MNDSLLKQLKEIFKKHRSIIIAILFWLLMIGMVILVHILQNPRQIYHADYLDKINNKPKNIFVVKHTIFNRMSCSDIENWAKSHLDFENINDDYVTFVSYDDMIDKNYPFLEKDYSRVVFSNLICEMSTNRKICISCPKWYE